VVNSGKFLTVNIEAMKTVTISPLAGKPAPKEKAG
jgi:hypothetical protein